MKLCILTISVIIVMFTDNSAAGQSAEKFEVSGISVILKPTVKDIRNVGIYFKGGVANYDTGKAGIENLALMATARCGAGKYSPNEFKDIADKNGINIFGSGSYDYGSITMNAVGKYFDSGWNLLVAAVKKPVFDEKEFGLLKQRVIADIKNAESDPNSRITQMAMGNVFKGTPYETDVQGTVNTVQSLSAQAAKNYYFSTLLSKNRMLVVVAGKISKKEITERIQKAFNDLPAKPYSPWQFTVPQITTNSLNIENRKLATNYIMGVVNAPVFTSNDYVPGRLAIAVLSDRLFREIRTNRNLSYAPYSSSVVLRMPYNFMYVSTTDPKASVEVMTDEVNKIIADGFSEKEFDEVRNLFITSKYMKEESAGAMTSSLANADVLGNWRMDVELVNRIQRTTPAEMSAVFRKYIKGINWNFLGDEKAAEAANAAFEMKVK